MPLSGEQTERYSRHIMLREIGETGQQKLIDAKVLIIGAGGLGCPAALYLAAAGTGTIGIADGDAVELSNLQRQIAHGTKDVGTPKADSVKASVNAINPDVNVITYRKYLDSTNIREIIREYDFVLDATDNFASKFLINDACVLEKKPFTHAGILRFSGQLMTYVPEHGPCYRCVFGDIPPKDAVPAASEAGIIGALAGVIGSLQAMEAVKFITGAGSLLTGYMLTYDALCQNFRKVRLPPCDGRCSVCGNRPTVKELTESRPKN